jgi:CTP-dependent riboflavin kinase
VWNRDEWKGQELPGRRTPWYAIRFIEQTGSDDLSGNVRPGRGLGSALLADPSVAASCAELTGLSIVPGTLNVRLPEAVERDGRWRYVPAEAMAPDWRERAGQTGYHMVDVVVAGRYRAVAFQADEPEGPGYPPEQIELMSDTHLRSALGLADGDPIQIAIVARDPGTGPPRPAPG